MKNMYRDIGELYSKVIGESLGMGPNSEDNYGKTISKMVVPTSPCKCEEGDENCEECEEKSEPGDPHEHVRKELSQIRKLARTINEVLAKEKTIEPWIFDKITRAHESLNSISTHLDIADEDGENNTSSAEVGAEVDAEIHDTEKMNQVHSDYLSGLKQ